MFQRLLQWLFKNPNKQIIVHSGKRISSALAKKRMDSWMQLVKRNNISTREIIIFQNLDKATKKQFSNEIISGTSPSKLLQKFRWLTSTPLERGLKKHPEMQKWWNSLPKNDRSQYQYNVNSNKMSFEQLKQRYRQNTMMNSGDEMSLTSILHPWGANKQYQTKVVNAIASKQGLQIKQFFSGGNTGLAAETTDGRIFKLTNTPSEVESALRIRRASPGKTQSLVVSSIRPLRFNGKTSEWYLLQMDKVTTLSPTEQKFWTREYNSFLDPQISKKSFASRIKNNSSQYSGAEQQEFLDFWNRLIPQRDKINKNFKSMKIWSPEAHQGNVGFDRYGQFQHFDAWSAGKYGQRSNPDLMKLQQQAYSNKPIDIDLTKLGIDLSTIP